MGRMVLEADGLGCADEVIVIAAALSIQDPRERPADQQAQADQAHARFADEDSDFLAYLNLWRYLREQQRELSGQPVPQALPRPSSCTTCACASGRTSSAQLRQVGQAGRHRRSTTRRPSREDDPPGAPVRAALARRAARRRAARVPRRARRALRDLCPGSGAARASPTWVMVAELVETSRLWGRTAARIDPQLGRAARRAPASGAPTSEPRWDRKRASVVATERVTLYGLPIVAGRTVAYGRHRPGALARAVHPPRAGRGRLGHPPPRSSRANRALVEEVEALEERARRRDILVDDQALFDFYAARIPDDVVSGAHFDRWWRDERRSGPDLLTFTRELLINPDAAERRSRAGRTRWTQGDLELHAQLPLRARHRARRRDRPRAAQGRCRSCAREGFDWLVPALPRRSSSPR